jgi:hypothetical protein
MPAEIFQVWFGPQKMKILKSFLSWQLSRR